MSDGKLLKVGLTVICVRFSCKHKTVIFVFCQLCLRWIFFFFFRFTQAQEELTFSSSSLLLNSFVNVLSVFLAFSLAMAVLCKGEGGGTREKKEEEEMLTEWHEFLSAPQISC